MTDLAPHAEKIARHLLGAPNLDLSQKDKRTGALIALRYGTNGSLSIPITGTEAGTFYDHEKKSGGSIFDLIKREKGFNNGAVFAWLRDELGIGEDASKGNGATKQKVVAAYIYCDAKGAPVFRVCRWAPRKTFTQARFDQATGKYMSGKGCMQGIELVPYHLDQIAAATAQTILIVEGEKDADRLAAIGLVATCNPGGAGKWPKVFGGWFQGRDVTIIPDNDQAGRDHAADVASKLQAHAAAIRILELSGLPEKGDVSDWLDGGGTAEQLQELIDQAPAAAEVLSSWAPATGSSATDEVVDRLARLSTAEYERLRKDEAQAIGVRAAVLDAMVRARREEIAPEAAVGQGRRIQLPEIEPWDHPVDGAELLAGLVGQLQRFVSMGTAETIATALWAVHAHAHEAAFHSPRLAVLSPIKGCGKSTLMRCVYRLTPRPLLGSNVSPSSVFRVIEASQPTLLIDEIDTTSEEMRAELVGIINSSHCRLDAQIIRSVPVPDGYEPRAFSTWAPIVLAAIGKLPEQWLDRSVVIPMERKARGDRRDRMRLDQDQGFGELARKAARWAADNLDALKGADPAMPVELPDRQADNWRGLAAIADLAGGDWPRKAREASKRLSSADDDRQSLAEMILSDLRDLFGDRDRMASAAIVSGLIALEGRPWAEMGRSRKPITASGLARLLKPFGIQSGGTIWLEDGSTAKGYRVAQFAEAWKRYLGPPPPAQTVRSSGMADSATFSDSKPSGAESDLTVANPRKATESAIPDDLTVAHPPEGANQRERGEI